MSDLNSLSKRAAMGMGTLMIGVTELRNVMRDLDRMVEAAKNQSERSQVAGREMVDVAFSALRAIELAETLSQARAIARQAVEDMRAWRVDA